MRTGTNPYKALLQVKPPCKITAGVLSHIPDSEGYYRHAFDTLKMCIASIHANADTDVDILVFDNGSIPAVRDYLLELQRAGKIDYLILSVRNIGRPNAIRHILRSSPGDLVFCADGDMYFHPGWVQAHLDVLSAFPEAGVIGGNPTRAHVAFHTKATMKWLETNGDKCDYQRGHFLTEDTLRKYLASFGAGNVDETLKEWEQQQDHLLTRRRVSAFVGSGHQAFLMPRRAIDALPHRRFEQATGMNPEIMDEVLDEQGFLRLSTYSPCVYHMGNRLTEPWLLEKYRELIEESPRGQQAVDRIEGAWCKWFWSRAKIRRILRRVYHWSYGKYMQTERG